MNFTDFDISKKLHERLDSLNISQPTDIQQLVIPRALQGESFVARAQTGSGKTLSYLIPTIERLKPEEQALILAPTRELVLQIGEVCRSICEMKCAVIYGGVEYEPQREVLAQNPQIIISTVGRLKDLINQGIVNISGLDIFILDEVDQMLDLGFRDDIIQLSKFRKPSTQTLALSATLPDSVKTIVEIIMGPEFKIYEIEGDSLAVRKIEQIGYYVSMAMMDQLLLHILRKESVSRSVIFTRSRKMADRVAELLRTHNFSAEAIHSDRSQAAREHIISRFRGGETAILVATDVIARGIDIENIETVYNFGLPQEPEQYIHRIGRTARAGRSGRAITLCIPEDKPLVDKVCKLMKQHISFVSNHPYSISTTPPKKGHKR